MPQEPPGELAGAGAEREREDGGFLPCGAVPGGHAPRHASGGVLAATSLGGGGGVLVLKEVLVLVGHMARPGADPCVGWRFAMPWVGVWELKDCKRRGAAGPPHAG